MRIFSFSEAYGPFPCEAEVKLVHETQRCKKQAWDVLLTDEENKSLPEQTGAVAAKHILVKGVGKMLCEDCLEIERKQNGIAESMVAIELCRVYGLDPLERIRGISCIACNP